MRGFSSFRKGVAEYFLYPFCSGHEAVILFFILSGFVLSIPAIALRAQTYPVFVIRRLFRIYMPYLAALILAILGDMVFHGHVTHSVWFNEAWSDQVKWRLVWQHLTFIGQYDTKPFDPPIWSLVFEMRISLVFPLLCAIALKLRPGWLLITAVFISGLSLVVIQLCHLQHFDTSFILTAHYAAFFMVGIYLARQKDVISRIVTHLSRRKRVAFAALSVLFYLYGSWVSMNIAHRFTGHDLWYQTEWITVLGAGGLIVCSLNSESWRRVLLWPPIHALGKMSYSVYLLNFIIMLLFVHLLYGRIPLLSIFSLCLVFVIAASWVFYCLVEMPLMNIGRRLTGYM